MLYDPVDAFFQGLLSAILRIPMTFIPLLAALACFILSNGELDMRSIFAFPLVIFGVAIAWAGKGVFFFIGLFAFLTYLIIAWRVLKADSPKPLLIILYVMAFVFFTPLIWDGKIPAWKPYTLGGSLAMVYLLIGYGLPFLVAHYRKNISLNRDAH